MESGVIIGCLSRLYVALVSCQLSKRIARLLPFASASLAAIFISHLTFSFIQEKRVGKTRCRPFLSICVIPIKSSFYR